MEGFSDNEEKIKKSFLAIYQPLQFSKPEQLGLEAQAADSERRCLFTKYMSCKACVSEEEAAVIFENGIQNYSNLVDDKKCLNNYWKHFKSLNVNTVNDPSEWISELKDPNIATKFVTQLKCASDPTLQCRSKKFNDTDVKNLIKLWERREPSSPRIRKLPCQESVSLFSNSLQNKAAIQKNNINVAEKLNNKVLSQKITEKSSCIKNNKISSKSSLVPKSDFEAKSQVKKQENVSQSNKYGNFRTARAEFAIQQQTRNQQQPKKTLGGKGVSTQFVSPFQEKKENLETDVAADERLKNIEPKMVELIKNEIMDCGKPITWDEIAGLENAKRIIKEIVVFPMLRPDIFTGLRRPPKGILLFGPPGTGKTLIGKCVASQSKSTFFSISASSLTSKYIGEGEKMVRALFAVARVEQPSVVFIDEIDSLLCQRSETEHESSRRMKTEFLVQLDGATTGDEDRILVIGATNRPYELDEAARRRLVKRLYIPLPELEARSQIVKNLLKSENHDLSDQDVIEISRLAEGYSGADMTNLCKEASMGPIRSIPFSQLEDISTSQVRKVTINDFMQALQDVRPSVSQKDLAIYLEWDRTYGSTSSLNRN